MTANLIYDAYRFLLEVDDVGDEISITKHDDGGLSIEINEPWAGDTETGFGATTSITLSPDEARRMIAWLKGDCE